MTHYRIGVMGSEEDLDHFVGVLNEGSQSEKDTASSDQDSKEEIFEEIGEDTAQQDLKQGFDKTYSHDGRTYEFIRFVPDEVKQDTQVDFFIRTQHGYKDCSLTKSSEGNERLSEKDFLLDQKSKLIALTAEFKNIDSTLLIKNKIELMLLKNRLEADLHQLKAQLANTKALRAKIETNNILVQLGKMVMEYSSCDPESLWPLIETIVCHLESEKQPGLLKRSLSALGDTIAAMGSVLPSTPRPLKQVAGVVYSILPGTEPVKQGVNTAAGAAGALANSLTSRLPGNPLSRFWRSTRSEEGVQNEQGLSSSQEMLRRIITEDTERAKKSLHSPRTTR